MAYGEKEERVRAAKDKLIQSKSPGAYEDATTISKQQGAKTNKEIESKAKTITHNRSVDAEKNLTRAKMHSANMELSKGTQAGHYVTSNSDNTKPLTPAQKQGEAKRPAVGTDADAKKKYGSKSHNNGYTN
jgi:hypothetical protein